MMKQWLRRMLQLARCLRKRCAIIVSASLAGLCVVGVSGAHATNLGTLERGWKPSAELAADGDYRLALGRLREMAELQRLMLEKTEFHRETQLFVDRLWASFERFDLKRFHGLLPEQQGDWRRLRIYGGRSGGRYQVGPDARDRSRAVNASGTYAPKLGDVSAVVKAKPVKGELGPHYLLDTEMALGVGNIDWPALSRATRETLRIIVDGDPSFAAESEQGRWYRKRVETMNPGLGPEDVRVITPLWASFPNMWDLLATLGQVEDVVVRDVEDRDYQHLSASLALRLDRMEHHYSSLAKFFTRMGALVKSETQVLYDGANLLRVSFDSDRLVAGVEGYVHEGRFLPVHDGRVAQQGVQLDLSQPARFTMVSDITMEIYGIVTRMRNLRARLDYRPTETGAMMRTHMNTMPRISVDGSALGVVPTSVINAMIPGDVKTLVHDFVSVLVNGNEGRGVTMRMALEQQAPRQSALIMNMAFEGLDNFMVRMGMSAVNERVIPDEPVSQDIERLLFDAQQAFIQDIDRFARVASLEPLGR